MKLWAEKIRKHIENWSLRLGPLNWWPYYVYHFTDVHNAVSILHTGKLHCRSDAERGIMQVDNASPEIIQNTREALKNYVRLYFRPKTPTQFRNEGIRPQNNRMLGGAHCPIPVFFCFDAFEVMAMDETIFSNGNMAASQVQYSGTDEFFHSIPFEQVFHNGYFPPEQHSSIVFHRNAEVLVPRVLDLTHLKAIVCRSAAESQTLLHFLTPDSRAYWQPKVRLGVNGFFERRWSFIEEVVVVDESIIFRFNPNTQTPGPFQVHFEYLEFDSNIPSIWHGTELANNVISFRVPSANIGVVRLGLDDSLAFQDRVVFKDIIPF